MENIFICIDYALFIIFAINVLYLLFYSIAYIISKPKMYPKAGAAKKIAILIPAYKEDSVIIGCAESCVKQNYPTNLYDTIVISDKMESNTIAKLKEMPVKVIEVLFEKSTKSKALNYAMAQLSDYYDIAVVLDADNIINANFLNEINDAFVSSPSIEYLQAHRVAKNLNNDMAYLDAISEEINNSIFRQGHSAVGLSAALIGSGMAFNYNEFKKLMLKIDAIGGFDKAIELELTFNKKRIYYLHYSRVLDEKIQSSNDFSRQRSRWLSAQVHYFFRNIKHLPKAIIHGKIDFCDKLFQQISIPRLLLLGSTSFIATLVSLISFPVAIKWWGLLAILLFALLISIPYRLYNMKIFKAVVKLPYYFILFFGTIFRVHKANKTFIHTQHGVKDNSKN